MQDITIYCDYGCPFTQRLEAILVHHGVAYDVTLVDEGPIPRVGIDGAELHETTVVADFLVERLDWDDAYPPDPLERARHRLAIRQLETIWPTGAAPRTARYLDEIEALVRPLVPAPSMLAFAAAPFFLRWSWIDVPTLNDAIAARPALHAWLRGAAALTDVVATTPDEQEVLRVHVAHLAG